MPINLKDIKTKLNKSSPIPLYRQILNQIETAIASRECLPGEQLPTESVFVAELGVSRVTLRQAMNAAVELGIIQRMPAKGTFISERNIGQSADKFVGYIVHHLTNSFNLHLMLGVEKALKSAGFHMVFCNSDGDPGKELSLIRNLITQNVQGFIVQPVVSKTEDEELQKLAIGSTPLVLLDREAVGVNADLVDSNHFEGGRLVANHLISHGFKEIQFVCTDAIEITSLALRYQGYVEGMESAGLRPMSPFIIKGVSELGFDETRDTTTDLGNAISSQLIDLLSDRLRPQALFAMNDVVAISILKIARQLNIRIPEDLALVGYDNLDIASHLNLTSVDQNSYQLGELAAKRLIHQIENGKGRAEHLMLPVRLIARNSSQRSDLANKGVERLIEGGDFANRR
jgi:DNA-binding LacI/PurR family transcriptional regulator